MQLERIDWRPTDGAVALFPKNWQSIEYLNRRFQDYHLVQPDTLTKYPDDVILLPDKVAHWVLERRRSQFHSPQP